ncbi:MAG: hypothetical protein U0P30_15035 [Vicinamibacterales bacterium]
MGLLKAMGGLAAAVVLFGMPLVYRRQVLAARAWSSTNGLPIEPPKSSMRLARFLEGWLQVSMAGQWEGVWVRVWVTPNFSYYTSKIAVTLNGPVTSWVQAPAILGLVTVRDGEVYMQGPFQLEGLPASLAAAVAHARALTGGRGRGDDGVAGQPTIDASART